MNQLNERTENQLEMKSIKNESAHAMQKMRWAASFVPRLIMYNCIMMAEKKRTQRVIAIN